VIEIQLMEIGTSGKASGWQTDTNPSTTLSYACRSYNQKSVVLVFFGDSSVLSIGKNSVCASQLTFLFDSVQ